MQFLPGSSRTDTAVWMHYMDANKTAGEEARRQLHKNAVSNIEQVTLVTNVIKSVSLLKEKETIKFVSLGE